MKVLSRTVTPVTPRHRTSKQEDPSCEQVSSLPCLVEGAPVHEQALALARKGALEQAAALLDQACTHGDQEASDRLVCNRAICAIELGDGEEQLPLLREVLSAHRSVQSAFLSAYCLSVAHLYGGQPRKALFYAQIAEAKAHASASRGWITSSLNQRGNAHVAVSQLEEARRCYEQALHFVDANDSARPLVILQNLGYLDALAGRFVGALRRLYRACRGMMAAGTSSALVHIDLSWTLAQVGRADLSSRHARRALVLECRPQNRKAALLLAAQAAKELGDTTAFSSFAAELARQYPGFLHLRDLLGSANLLPVLNLRA